MRDTTVARNYAEALFMIAEKNGTQDAFAASLSEVGEMMDANPSIGVFLQTPKVDLAAKKKVLRSAFTDRVDPLVLNFLLVVLEKRRQRLIGEIAREFSKLLDEKMGRVHVQVTLAHAADAATEQSITKELSRILGRTAIPHITVDPKIVGGIVVRYGDSILDGSVRRRLAGLRNRLYEATV
ncbi:MAG: ATP synthase F1 subunit delta [Longimicrobiales bacterium]